MSRDVGAAHVERVRALIAQGDVETAKAVHNTGIVLAAQRARNGVTIRRHLPAFREAKALLDRAEGK